MATSCIARSGETPIASGRSFRGWIEDVGGTHIIPINNLFNIALQLIWKRWHSISHQWTGGGRVGSRISIKISPTLAPLCFGHVVANCLLAANIMAFIVVVIGFFGIFISIAAR